MLQQKTQEKNRHQFRGKMRPGSLIVTLVSLSVIAVIIGCCLYQYIKKKNLWRKAHRLIRESQDMDIKVKWWILWFHERIKITFSGVGLSLPDDWVAIQRSKRQGIYFNLASFTNNKIKYLNLSQSRIDRSYDEEDFVIERNMSNEYLDEWLEGEHTKNDAIRKWWAYCKSIGASVSSSGSHGNLPIPAIGFGLQKNR